MVLATLPLSLTANSFVNAAYPNAPGFKVDGPAKAAALAETGRSAELRAKVLGMEVQFSLTPDGIKVRSRGMRQFRVIPYAEIINLSKRQPLLFPQL